MRGGVDVTVAQLRSANVVRQLDGFTPVVPRFPVRPLLVQVLPGRRGGPGAVFVYRFPRSAATPVDGRVVVSEQPERRAPGAGPRFTASGNDMLLHLANGDLALIRHHDGRASAWVSIPGLLILIDGPALPPALAIQLAKTFR